METRTIYNPPQFLKWKDQLCFELNKIQGDNYVHDIIKLLNGFSGLSDENRFEKLESKLRWVREHLDEYSDN